MHRSTLLFPPIVNPVLLVLKSILWYALAYSKLFCCSAKNWIGGYTGDVGWAQYKTVKNWAEVSVVARDTISVVYYSPAAN